ncbi:hypothetical protein OSTOST_22699 [Ostertagia ostertagi]
MCFNGSSNGGPDFGIGELVEEFSNLSSYTPPPTPAATSCTEIPSENAGAAFALSDSSNAANAFPKTFAAPLLKSLGDQLRPTLSSSVPVFSSASTNFVGVVQLSSSAPVPPLLDSLDGSHSSFPVSGCDSFTPTGSSLPSTCDGSVVTSDTSTNPPRAVRRFQYWCRVLQTRRRNPVCRFCYERYVLMCLDSRQPIPSQFERGMWHGHNMKERGLVTMYAIRQSAGPNQFPMSRTAHSSFFAVPCSSARTIRLFPYSVALISGRLRVPTVEQPSSMRTLMITVH